MPPLHTVKLATRAMATRFELVLTGSDPVHLRSAGEEAIREIDRIGRRFNFHNPSSELSELNRNAFARQVTVAGDLFELLQHCHKENSRTIGAFDPTVAPLMRLWDFSSDRRSLPRSSELKEALITSGWQHVALHSSPPRVEFTKEGVQIDLGGIAKGWALDEAADILRESGVTCALLHGGTSSVVAIGSPSDKAMWHIGIADPYVAENPPSWFTHVELADTALSVSAIHGKSLEIGEEEYGHVINPATGMAVSSPLVSVVLARKAVTADAWSTALLAGARQPSSHLIADILSTALFEKTASGWTARPVD